MGRTAAAERFAFYSEVPCLDFMVTLRGRKEERRETLTTWGDFLDWCVKAGVLGENESRRLRSLPARETHKYLHSAIRLREVLYRIVSAQEAKRAVPSGDVAWLNRLLRRGRVYWQLQLDGRGTQTKQTVTMLAEPWRPLVQIAQSALDLMTSDDLDMLRACANPRCSVLFVDRSKNHTRRWCSMARCGNLIKVTNFYARKRAERLKLKAS